MPDGDARHVGRRGEVYLDCNEGVLTTSFHLNDAASTIVQVSLDRASGELSAL